MLLSQRPFQNLATIPLEVFHLKTHPLPTWLGPQTCHESAYRYPQEGSSWYRKQANPNPSLTLAEFSTGLTPRSTQIQDKQEAQRMSGDGSSLTFNQFNNGA